uniref:Uncharacterized protein n=1 Tax=Anguilla anguilla TaxID=7936 RepID=A0A0E9XM73_ANGAN
MPIFVPCTNLHNLQSAVHKDDHARKQKHRRQWKRAPNPEATQVFRERPRTR